MRRNERCTKTRCEKPRQGIVLFIIWHDGKDHAPRIDLDGSEDCPRVFEIPWVARGVSWRRPHDRVSTLFSPAEPKPLRRQVEDMAVEIRPVGRRGSAAQPRNVAAIFPIVIEKGFCRQCRLQFSCGIGLDGLRRQALLSGEIGVSVKYHDRRIRMEFLQKPSRPTTLLAISEGQKVEPQMLGGKPFRYATARHRKFHPAITEYEQFGGKDRPLDRWFGTKPNRTVAVVADAIRSAGLHPAVRWSCSIRRQATKFDGFLPGLAPAEQNSHHDQGYENIS